MTRQQKRIKNKSVAKFNSPVGKPIQPTGRKAQPKKAKRQSFKKKLQSAQSKKTKRQSFKKKLQSVSKKIKAFGKSYDQVVRRWKKRADETRKFFESMISTLKAFRKLLYAILKTVLVLLSIYIWIQTVIG
jgi:hypothetical protein